MISNVAELYIGYGQQKTVNSDEIDFHCRITVQDDEVISILGDMSMSATIPKQAELRTQQYSIHQIHQNYFHKLVALYTLI
ncbi:hypothetical protein IQ244_24595 [Nostoc sp. LEGE 06077]|nr:hypothetical protein [Nostoc sp. LEGE 06077]